MLLSLTKFGYIEICHPNLSPVAGRHFAQMASRLFKMESRFVVYT